MGGRAPGVVKVIPAGDRSSWAQGLSVERQVVTLWARPGPASTPFYLRGAVPTGPILKMRTLRLSTVEYLGDPAVK